MNLWVLIFIFDLVSTLLDVHLDGFFVSERDKSIAPTIPSQGKITSGLGAGVEMLMKPLIGRHYHAARLPVNADHIAVIGPKQRITLTA